MQHRLGATDLSSVTSRSEQCTSVRQNGGLTTENMPEKLRFLFVAYLTMLPLFLMYVISVVFCIIVRG